MSSGFMATDFADKSSAVSSTTWCVTFGTDLDSLSDMDTDHATTAFHQAFCAQLRKLREARGLTIEEAASFLDMTGEALRKYETRTPLPHRYMQRVCKFYNLTIEEYWQTVIRATAKAADGGNVRVLRPRRKAL